MQGAPLPYIPRDGNTPENFWTQEEWVNPYPGVRVSQGPAGYRPSSQTIGPAQPLPGSGPQIGPNGTERRLLPHGSTNPFMLPAMNVRGKLPRQQATGPVQQVGPNEFVGPPAPQGTAPAPSGFVGPPAPNVAQPDPYVGPLSPGWSPDSGASPYPWERAPVADIRPGGFIDPRNQDGNGLVPGPDGFLVDPNEPDRYIMPETMQITGAPPQQSGPQKGDFVLRNGRLRAARGGASKEDLINWMRVYGNEDALRGIKAYQGYDKETWDNWNGGLMPVQTAGYDNQPIDVNMDNTIYTDRNGNPYVDPSMQLDPREALRQNVFRKSTREIFG